LACGNGTFGTIRPPGLPALPRQATENSRYCQGLASITLQKVNKDWRRKTGKTDGVSFRLS
jgi:hypothetical protein